MRLLYNLPLSPFCREVRLVLAEKKLEASLVGSEAWADGEAFLELSPAGTVPVLIEDDGTAIPERGAIVEYLEEAYPNPSLIPGGPRARAEVRRLVAWFDVKFAAEVSTPVLYEKIDKRELGLGAPDMTVVREALGRINGHLAYIGRLVEARRWLAGEDVSLADIAAAAHLSCLDFLGDVPWRNHPEAKEWYVRIKSRPSFRPLLSDLVPGLPPPRHYADLDF
jgi:glutathione S-transferase